MNDMWLKLSCEYGVFGVSEVGTPGSLLANDHKRHGKAAPNGVQRGRVVAGEISLS
jgi:hypothetical protein